ncbi:MAG TPA: hypothetical protein VK638_56310 [Edaphobacter sp.]|nr:hypothetical protein [Edaphobacter sp.]
MKAYDALTDNSSLYALSNRNRSAPGLGYTITKQMSYAAPFLCVQLVAELGFV